MTKPDTSAMLLGALVSDAACLGVHWIYDADRIAQIARTHGGASFVEVDARNYDGVKGYFAHGGRKNGMLTQYGEVLRLAIQSMNARGGAFDVAAYQAAFAAHFGAGGSYRGYIDRPTRAALDNIAAGQTPSGSDDDQNPAVARLPAIMASYAGTSALADMVTQATHVTNVNAVADAYAQAFADMLGRVLRGEAIASALQAAADGADASIKAELSDALSTSDDNSTDYAGKVGRACHLPTAGPVMFHVLRHATSYQDAVERNALAGGDNAGRSILIGAVMGAVHGIATPKGIPLSWIVQLEDVAQIWSDCAALAQPS